MRFILLILGIIALKVALLTGQNSQCIADQMKLTKSPASDCNDILTQSDIFDMSDADITKFCEQYNCSTLLFNLYSNITRDCGGGGGGVSTISLTSTYPSIHPSISLSIKKYFSFTFTIRIQCTLILWKTLVSSLVIHTARNYGNSTSIQLKLESIPPFQLCTL